jgi:hypothetical protein
MQGNNKPAAVDFGVIAANATKYEISRTFAAMLQLINNRYVRPTGNASPLCEVACPLPMRAAITLTL